jgi:hypothetical protein
MAKTIYHWSKEAIRACVAAMHRTKKIDQGLNAAIAADLKDFVPAVVGFWIDMLLEKPEPLKLVAHNFRVIEGDERRVEVFLTPTPEMFRYLMGLSELSEATEAPPHGQETQAPAGA